MLVETLENLRADVAEAIGRDAYTSPAGIRGPCAIVFPRSPWVSATAETWSTYQVNLGVQLVASPGATNAWILEELTSMADDLLTNLPNNWVLETISGPLVGSANGSNHQLLSVDISTTV